jgi:CubicO group peptidase (beta-lactamase class C family)
MVLNEGRYKDNQIVSSEWIRQMTTPYLKLGERFGSMEYGYLWYKPFEDRDVYAAIGDSGNIIYVNKEMNLAVGMTGTFKPRIFDRVEFIEKKVIPAVT